MYRVLKKDTLVFPAPAGINRAFMKGLPFAVGVPRASGDKPKDYTTFFALDGCSPRQRG